MLWISCPIFTSNTPGREQICGRKGKFGLNCQAISDVRGRILDISIVYGGVSSDCLVFEGSGIYEDLEVGLLHEYLVLFGDNAYLNSHYMVTPFPNVSSGSKDDFNFSTRSCAFVLSVHLGCWFFGGGFEDLPYHRIFLYQKQLHWFMHWQSCTTFVLMRKRMTMFWGIILFQI